MGITNDGTQKLKPHTNEHCNQAEVVGENIQHISREVTALVGKIEDQQSEQTTSDRVAANSKKRMKELREEIS